MRIYPVNQKKIIVGYRGGILLKIGNIIQHNLSREFLTDNVGMI